MNQVLPNRSLLAPQGDITTIDGLKLVAYGGKTKITFCFPHSATSPDDGLVQGSQNDGGKGEDARR